MGFWKREAKAGIDQFEMVEKMFEDDIGQAVDAGRNILDRLATAFDEGLAKAKAERERLETEIAGFKHGIGNLQDAISDREEKLRQAIGADAILKRGQADLVALSDPPIVVAEPSQIVAE